MANGMSAVAPATQAMPDRGLTGGSADTSTHSPIFSSWPRRAPLRPTAPAAEVNPVQPSVAQVVLVEGPPRCS